MSQMRLSHLLFVRPFSVATAAYVSVIAVFLSVTQPASASFHFMQIEQVIGGVNGDPSAQAIQFRMRSDGQEMMNKAKLIAWDANGENPIVLIDFTSDVPVGALGARVLVATQQFSQNTMPFAQPDFILEKPIPESYLPAGSLTFENDEGTLIVCRLSWGGDDYTGSTTGATTNDDNGDFGPPLADALPTQGLQAMLIQIAATAKSTTNLDDYALTDGPAIFTNNAGDSFTVAGLQCPNDPDQDADGDFICGDLDNCPDTANPDQLDSDGDGAGDVCDVCPADARTTDDPTLCAQGSDDDSTPDDGDPDDTVSDDDSSGDDSSDDTSGDPGDDDEQIDSDQGGTGHGSGSGTGTGSAGCAAGFAPSAFGMIAFHLISCGRRRPQG